MSFIWKDLLEVADHLQQVDKDGLSKEACGRSAISRAYYAAFCHARNYARDRRNFTPEYSERDHANVRRHFEGSKKRGVASALDMLRQWRNAADYEDSIGDTPSIVKSSLAKARNIIEDWLK